MRGVGRAAKEDKRETDEKTVVIDKEREKNKQTNIQRLTMAQKKGVGGGCGSGGLMTTWYVPDILIDWCVCVCVAIKTI